MPRASIRRMGHRTTRRRAKQNQTNRPSTFFLIALAIGLILFVIMAVVLVRRPAVKQGAIARSTTVMLAFAASASNSAAR